MLKAYLMENYGYNEPIFIKETVDRWIISKCSTPVGKAVDGNWISGEI